MIPTIRSIFGILMSTLHEEGELTSSESGIAQTKKATKESKCYDISAGLAFLSFRILCRARAKLGGTRGTQRPQIPSYLSS